MRFFILVLFLCLAPAGVWAAKPAVAPAQDSSAKLTDKDWADIARIAEYLNHLHNISADFLQIDDRGGTMTGKIEIQRPGKMRVVYNPPSKDFIVADGDTVHIWNADLQSHTDVDEGSSLAEFILRDPIRLAGDVTVTKLQRFPAKLEMTLVETNDAAAGQLTLIFEDNPLKLRQWRVVDPQGITTGVSLQNMREDITFPRTTFTFVPPNFGRNTRSDQAP